MISSASFGAGNPSFGDNATGKRRFSGPAPGLRRQRHMSPVGQALHDRFETVCRSELQRLRKKTASLTDAERAQVESLALEVTRKLAVTLDAAVDAKRATTAAPTIPINTRFIAFPPGKW